MNFVVVKHPNCSTHYLFKCPENIKFSPFIDVVCETRFGKVDGVTVTPSFEVPDEAVDTLCELYGTRAKDLKSVKAVFLRTDIDLDDAEKLDSFAEIFGRAREQEEEPCDGSCGNEEDEKEQLRDIANRIEKLADLIDDFLADECEE